jgi:hypothetical protein
LVHVTGDGKHLKIGSVRVEHAGFYSCRATNELGSAEVSYQVSNLYMKHLIMQNSLGGSHSKACFY